MNEKQKKSKGLILDGLLIGGWMMISAGVGILSISAGLIVAGTLAIAGGALLGRRLND